MSAGPRVRDESDEDLPAVRVAIPRHRVPGRESDEDTGVMDDEL